MTQQAAKNRAKSGHKISHLSFVKGDFIQYKENKECYCFDNGVEVPDWFWNAEWIQKGWSLVK